MAQVISTTNLTKDFTSRLTERLTGSGHLESLINSHLSSQLSAFTTLSVDSRIMDLEMRLLAFEYAVQIACEFPAKLKQRLSSHSAKSQHVEPMSDGRAKNEPPGGISIAKKDTNPKFVPEINNTTPVSQYTDPAIDLKTRNMSPADELISTTKSAVFKPNANNVEPQKAVTAAAIDLKTRNMSPADELISTTKSAVTKTNVNNVEPQKAATAARGITASPVSRKY